jgi:AcrR family transcriptional regulator
MSQKKKPAPYRPEGEVALRKSDKTRQAILDAALKYLWTHPYRDLTVNELMTMAGSSRSAFYRYYEDLPAMMEHLLSELKEKVLAGTTPWFTGEGDPILQLEKSLENLVSDLLSVRTHSTGCYRCGSRE